MTDSNTQTKASFHKYLNIYGSLKEEYSSREAEYIDIRDLLSPGSGSFSSSENNKTGSQIDHEKLLDAEAVSYLDITAYGLYGGLINPASQWFDIVPKNPNYLSNHLAAKYCEEIRRRFEFLFHNSNFYNAAQINIKEWPVFGIGPMLIEERDYEVVFFRPFTIGEYYLGMDGDGNYNKLARSIFLSAHEIVETFGIDNCSQSVIQAYNGGDTKKRFTIHHLICPNQFTDSGYGLTEEMPFVDLYWQGFSGLYSGGTSDPLYDTSTNNFKWLRKSGYHSNPLAVLTWERKNFNSVYPIGIGHKILGDVREIQATTKRGSINEAFATNPALALHSSLARKPVVPGSRFYTEQDPSKVASEIYRVNAHIEVIENKKKTMKERVRAMSMADLMLIFANKNRGTLTATEVSAIINEQMVMMSPVYLSASSWLKSIFSRTWDIGVRRGFFPPAPEEISDIIIEPQFISSIAKAQRMAEVGSIQDLILYLSQLAQISPEVMDNLDSDLIVKELAIKLGVSSKIRPEELVSQIRKQRAEAMAKASELEQKEKEMKIAKDASKAKIEPQSILGYTMQNQGIEIPQEPNK